MISSHAWPVIIIKDFFTCIMFIFVFGSNINNFEGWSGESEDKEGVLRCGCMNDAIAGFIFSSGLLSRSDVHIQSIAVT